MVKSLLNLLTVRQTSIVSGAAVIMITVILGKILGLVRDRLLAYTFSPDHTEIFFAAFKLPDAMFQILILGGLSVAFIPVFTEYFEEKGKSGAFDMARAVLNISLLLFIIVAIFLYIFATPITSSFIVPGFTLARQLQVAELTRIILFGQIILIVGAFFIGVLQSFQRFIVASLPPVFYNLGIILGIVFFSKSLGITGAAVGVIIGAVLHVLVQVPSMWSMGFRFKFPLKFMHPGVKEIMHLMGIRTIGLAAEQINEIVGTAMASLTTVGSFTFLTYAQHLQIVPVGLFGTALAQAALPVLAAERARGRIEEFKVTLLTTLHQILFLTLPATAILIVIRIPLVRLIFGAGQFNWNATVLTGLSLAYLAIGVSAQSISLLLVRGFYAMKDTKTPVQVSLITVVLNIILSVYFVKVLQLEVWSIGLASSISATISVVLLFYRLHFKVGKFDLALVFKPFLKMLMATIIMGVALYIPIKLLDQVIFDTTKTVNLLMLTGISAIFAISVYIFLVWFMDVRELATYLNLLKQIGKIQTLIKSEELIQENDTP